MIQRSLENTAAVVTLAALATISAAWGFELLGGYIPCPLCLQQRWPYYIGIPFAALAWWLAANDRPKASRLLLAAFMVAMLVGAGLGVHHVGVEWRWWPGPDTCAIGGGLSGGLPNLDTARVIACDEAQWRLMGLSFAGWNVVISVALAGLAAMAIARKAGD
jgi:disulfide bond formation protein DsbB